MSMPSTVPTSPTQLRDRAVKRLRGQSNGQRNGERGRPWEASSAADAPRLLHELQVHQIELEMQNEELRKARDEMEAGLDKYSELYDFAPVGYLTLDRDGAIHEANLSAASMLKIPRAPLMKQRFGFFVAPADRPVFNAYLQAVFKNEARQESDVQLLVRDNPPITVRLRANRSESGEACRLAMTDITEHKLAEAATAQLAAIVQSSSDAIIGIDLRGIITSWNAGAEKLFGYSAREMTGTPGTRLLLPDQLAGEVEIMRRIRHGDSVEHIETVRVTKDGRQLDMSVTVSPIRLTSGEIVGASILAHDISERKRATDRLRLLWAAAGVLLSTNDPDRMLRGLFAKIGPVLGVDTYFNYMVDGTGAALRLASYAGIPAKTVPSIQRLEFGLTISGTVARDHRPMYVPHLQESTDPRARKVRSFGLRAYACNPLMSGKVLLGTLAYGSRTRDRFDPDVLAMLQTITQYLAVAYERQLSAESVRVSETRYRRLFEAAQDGILILDPHTRKITNANPFAIRFLGYSREQLLRKELWQIGLLKDSAASRKAFRELQQQGFIRYEDLPLITQKGQHREVEFVSNLYAEDGVPVIQCNIRDITMRKQAEKALAVAQLQLSRHAGHLETVVARRTAELSATNRRLVTSIAATRRSEAELRALFLQSELMQKKLRLLTRQILTVQEEERKRISRELHDEVVQTLVGINVELSALVHGNSTEVRHVKDKIARTQRLVENSVHQVHRFARELRPAVLDDLGLIPALHSYCQGLAERKEIKIKLSAFRGVESLGSDERTVLFRVAQESLSNVTRHARATIVRIDIREFSGAVRMEIRDNGKSFPVQKFLQAKNPRRLGLVGMRERVEMVGGRLTIESLPGKGTTVRAEIPLLPEKTTPSP